MTTAEGPLTHLREHNEVIFDDLKIVTRFAGRQARLLDVGAGRGRFVTEARLRGVDAIGLEREAGASYVWGRDKVPGVIGDGFHTPFASSSFDVVRMKEVLEHVEDPLALVREARRLLRKGGIFIAHIPSPYSQFYPVANFWDDYTHVRPISRYGLTRLMADARLDLDSIEGYMSGRNAAERLLGKVLSRFLPHMYRVVARLPDAG